MAQGVAVAAGIMVLCHIAQHTFKAARAVEVLVFWVQVQTVLVLLVTMDRLQSLLLTVVVAALVVQMEHLRLG
jgi:hypothetical protein